MKQHLRIPTRQWRTCAVAMFIAIAVSQAGCIHFWQSDVVEYSMCGQRLLATPVTIVPVPTDAAGQQILDEFCGELASALHHAGVPDVRLEELPVEHCGDLFNGRFEEPDRLDSIEELRIMVTIRDFRPYRPMRMAVDVRVIDPQSAVVFGRVGDVFIGPTDRMPRDTPTRLRPTRKTRREENIDEIDGVHANSPRWFVADVAWMVSDRLLLAAP